MENDWSHQSMLGKSVVLVHFGLRCQRGRTSCIEEYLEVILLVIILFCYFVLILLCPNDLHRYGVVSFDYFNLSCCCIIIFIRATLFSCVRQV